MKSEHWQRIPTKLNCQQFEQFVLPHLSMGGRGPAPKLSLHAIFNYILQQLYMGCQWKELPIEKDRDGHPEIHYTRVYSAAHILLQTWPQQVAAPIANEIHNVLTQTPSGLLTISVILAIYFSSSGVEAVRIGLNRAYDVRDSRPWWLVAA